MLDLFHTFILFLYISGKMLITENDIICEIFEMERFIF